MVAMRRSRRSLRPRRTYRKKAGARKYTRKPRSALAVARRALKLAKVATESASEVKYFTYQTDTNISQPLTTGNYGLAAHAQHLCVTSGWSEMFSCGPLRGNKAYLKWIKGAWSINMHDEEEACNFTVAVIKKKADTDYTDISRFIDTRNGVAFYDPRHLKVCYYKQFELYPGGSLGGDRSGTVIKNGKFYLPINKMIRFDTQGSTGTQTSEPQSYQDQYFFLVHTNNQSVDLENPKLSLNLMAAWRDTDIN